MTAVETRPAPGELIYRTPECPVCGENVSCDGDSFWCEPCGATWGMNASDQGEWGEESAQCRVVLTHGGHEVLSGRCVLSADHAGRHNNDRTLWDAREVAGGYHRQVGSTETEAES